VVLAQSATDPIGGALLQYGVLGAVTLVLFVAIRTMYKRLTADADEHRQRANRLEDELRALNQSVRTDCVKALTDAARVMSDTLVALQASRRDRP
jgi:hypothetical protein